MLGVYILFSRLAKRTYVGFSEDIERRFDEHNEGKVKATVPYIPWEILFIEQTTTVAIAKRREKYWKSGAGRRKIKEMFDSRSNGV